MDSNERYQIQVNGVSRRTLVRQWGPAALAGAVLGGTGVLLHDRSGRHRPPQVGGYEIPTDWRVDPDKAGSLAIAGGAGPAENLRRGLDAFGGIGHFVKRGEKVVIKPNCAWDRRPAQAANTDPELIAEIARLCLEAGAASVVVADNSCHDPSRAFTRSGIGEACAAVGATIAHQNSVGTEVLDLGGSILGPWEVLRPIAEADRVINVPVVKQHTLARVTVGMKNWIGAVVGQRPNLHQRLAQATAELGAAFRPTLTVVDATRILTGGGPTGGSLALVQKPDMVAVCTDPVAADAWGASLLDVEPGQLPHLAIAERLGLGTSAWRNVQVEL